MNVIRLTQTVGSDAAATFAVGARVGHKDGVSVAHKELSVTCDAETVVGHAVQKQNGIAVALRGDDRPSTKRNAVARCDFERFKFRAERVGDPNGRGLHGSRKRSAMQVK